jgi:hypothetical protein
LVPLGVRIWVKASIVNKEKKKVRLWMTGWAKIWMTGWATIWMGG